MLTHTTKDRLNYSLFWSGEKVGEAMKLPKGFILTKAEFGSFEQDPPSYPTMRDLKADVEKNLSPEIKSRPPKIEKLSFAEAFEKTGASHTGMYIYAREAKKIWPEWSTDQRALFILRQHYEACARYQDGFGQMARDWLERNPTVGQYDQGEYDERLQRVYAEAA